MADELDAVLALKRFGKQYQGVLEWWPAFAGDGQGNVNTSQAYWFLARYPLQSSPTHEVFCDKINLVDNLRIIVGYTAYHPNRVEVIDVFDQRVEVVDSNDNPINPGQIGYSRVPLHWANHQYLGGDQGYINWRQITPLGVFPTNPVSLSVQVFNGYIARGSSSVFVNSQVVNLESHIPTVAGDARYVLISYDSTGAVVITDGAINAGGFNALTVADIPATPSGNWRSCAVILYTGQTAIVENRTEIDFFDLRFPEQSAAGLLLAAGSNTQVQYNNGGVLGADARFTFDSVNKTVGVDNVQWNLTPTVSAPAEGLMYWNADDGTLNLGMPGGNVNLQLGQELLLRVQNQTGSTITNGQLVYISGGTGNHAIVSLARADAESTSQTTLGMATESIADNTFGYVTLTGLVRDVDTNAYAPGTMLYLSPITAGAYTGTMPVAPNHSVRVGQVIRQHASQGAIFVRIDNGYEISELHDVLISTPATFQVLTYDVGGPYWKNSSYLLDGTAGGKTVLNVTSGKTLTLTATDNYNLTIPTTGTAALVDFANVFSQVQTIGSSTSYTDYLLILNGSHPGTGDAGIKLFPDNTGAHGSPLIDFWNDAGAAAPAYARMGRNVSSGGTALFTGTGGSIANAFMLGSRDATPVEFFTSDAGRVLIDASGNVGINNITPGARLDVFSGIITDLSASVSYGIKFLSWYFGTDDSAMQMRGLSSQLLVTAPPTGKTLSAPMIGANYQVDVSGDVGVVSDVRGLNLAVDNATANTTNMYAGRLRFGATSGNIDNLYGLYFDPYNSAGTIGQVFGLFIQPITQGWATNRAIQSMGGESYHAGNFGFGNNGTAFSAATLLHGINTTTTTNAVLEIGRLEARVSTASTGGAAGFGPGLTWYGESATDGNYRQMAQLDTQWSTATDASRKARAVLSVYDTAAREAWRSFADGAEALTGFGLSADPAAFVHVAPSVAAAASVRIPAGTAPSSPGEGDKWNDSTQKADIAFLSGIKQSRVGCIFTQTQNVTVANTVTETTLIGTGIGTVTLPANFFTAGKTLLIRLRGYFSTTGAPNIQFKLKHGAVTLVDSGAFATPANVANQLFDLYWVITCYTTGATGTVWTQGQGTLYGAHASSTMFDMETTAAVTIDTTASGAMDATVTWGTANPSDTITATNFSVEVLN